jgi:hypothetical protein
VPPTIKTTNEDYILELYPRHGNGSKCLHHGVLKFKKGWLYYHSQFDDLAEIALPIYRFCFSIREKPGGTVNMHRPANALNLNFSESGKKYTF